MPKPRLQLLNLPPEEQQAVRKPRAQGDRRSPPGLSHLDQQLLDQVVREVHADGYYADFVKAFMVEGASQAETMDAICQWAQQVGLKASFSRDGSICVFELG